MQVADVAERVCTASGTRSTRALLDLLVLVIHDQGGGQLALQPGCDLFHLRQIAAPDHDGGGAEHLLAKLRVRQEVGGVGQGAALALERVA